jgi:probable rRNA maturation factor
LSKKDIAWELIFSEAKIVLQWEEYWLWSEKEFYKLLIHSILHILGYDHEKESDYKVMQALENEIWQKTQT